MPRDRNRMAEEIVPPGRLDPDGIDTPGTLVHRVRQRTHATRIGPRTVRTVCTG
jgi:hypothetical protein